MSDRNFSPEKILFLELGLSWDNNPIYTRICEVDYISEKKFKDILTNILTSNIYPQPNCFPIFDNTQSQARKLTETSLRCTGYDTEIILYIPSQLGVFETKKAPISHFKPQLIDNPRIFYRDNNMTKEFNRFSEDNSPATSQLAAFSYRGAEAKNSRPNGFDFSIDATRHSSPMFPGSGDIGHPGGNTGG